MLPVLPEDKTIPAGYRLAGSQLIRVDLAEKILRAAFDARAKATTDKSQRNVRFRIDLALPVSVGLEEDNARRLLGSAGFRVQRAPALAEGAFGPAAPDSWTWRPRRAGDQRRDQKGGKRHHKEGKPDHKQAKGKHKGRKPDRGGSKDGRKGPRGKPPPRHDTGPARSTGAFDGLKDLLRG
jgi:ATP-dependent RNA helicase SUPV3L1/SUV3